MGTKDLLRIHAQTLRLLRDVFDPQHEDGDERIYQKLDEILLEFERKYLQ